MIKGILRRLMRKFYHQELLSVERQRDKDREMFNIELETLRQCHKIEKECLALNHERQLEKLGQPRKKVEVSSGIFDSGAPITPPKKRGRPLGSKNKPKKRGPGRPRKEASL